MATPSPVVGADRIDLLHTFVRIVESGSLSAAAAQLGTTQPTVSRRLQALERLFGLHLIQRSTHRMTLTADGERCYAHARTLVDEWEAIQADLRGEREVPRGRLRVVVPHAFGQAQLLDPMLQFLARYPQVTLEWMLEDSPVDFIADSIDCAIRVGGVDQPQLVAVPLAEVPRIVIAAPALVGAADPHDPSLLPQLPWIALTTFYRERFSLLPAGGGPALRIDIQPRLLTDNLFVVRRAALSGLGAAVVSSWLVADDLREGRLLQLVPGWEAPPLPVHLVFPSTRQIPSRLRAFIDTMKASLPQTHGMRSLD
ncbi:LysR family transcriptional regulator [Stenotrophomonas sp. NPDC077464]|uniref:LysR family transcriptional regulator n=1 Tax=unclassified Stenotrophomonas TaxID=196198 RepID=UPI0037D8A5D8